jgi:hypothetical protein
MRLGSNPTKERSQRRVIQDEAECSCVIILEQEGQWEENDQIDPELLAEIYSELSKEFAKAARDRGRNNVFSITESDQEERLSRN